MRCCFQVQPVAVFYPWIDVEAFESAHEEVRIGSGALCSHRASFLLDVVTVVETEVVQEEHQGE